MHGAQYADFDIVALVMKGTGSAFPSLEGSKAVETSDMHPFGRTRGPGADL